MNTGWFAFSAFALFAHSCQESPPAAHCSDRTQFGGNFMHDNSTCVVGQKLEARLSTATYDPFVQQEIAEANDSLFVHYQMPLTRADQLFMMRKTGTFVPCNPPGSGQPAPCGMKNVDHIQWTEVGYRNDDGRLTEQWTYTSDWKPFPSPQVRNVTFQQVFQPALGSHALYVPGAGGTVHVVDLEHGKEIDRFNPFGADDAPADVSYYDVSPFTVDSSDNLYYNVVQLDSKGAIQKGLLVRIGADRQKRVVDYKTLTPGAPAPTDMCRGVYRSKIDPLPWPMMANGVVVPPPLPIACGIQAPPSDLAPAISADGSTLFTASRAVGDTHYAYLVAVDTRDLSLRWNRSLRGLLHDGCGVLNAYQTDPNAALPCTNGAPKGIDRNTGEDPAGTLFDGDTASPVVLPDGSLLLGAFTAYNYSRGHLLEFSPSGAYLANFDFGWDITPAVWRHDGTYSIVDKDNHYFDNLTEGPYQVTQLDANLKVEWRATNTETQTCHRDGSDNVVCVDDHQHDNGFEWCINAPGVDARGNVFVTSEDGNSYHLGQGGSAAERQFLNVALGSGYTPTILDRHGHVISLNAGILYVLGTP